MKLLLIMQKIGFNVCFIVRAIFTMLAISLALLSTASVAQYVYAAPSKVFVVDSLPWVGAVRVSSPEGGCQAIADGYTRAAAPDYSGRVRLVTQLSPIFWACYFDRSYQGVWYSNSERDGGIRLVDECPPTYVFDNSLFDSDGNVYLRCRGAAPLTVSLTVPTETRPAGTGGSSTVTLTAKVTEGETPKAGVAVNFSADVISSSGGHDHDDASRPKGDLSLTQGTTDANGEVKLTFAAPQVAGTHTIKAICGRCSNSPSSKEIQVKVPELLAIFALPFRDAQWAYPGIGQVSGRHSANHYLTVAAVTRLLGISQKFKSIWPDAPRLTLNDASLKWGGKFDIPATWERNPRAHAEHRIGDNIDVRANEAPGAVPANIRKVVFRWLRDESVAEDNIPPEFVIESVNPLRESIGSQNEHFHLRLGN